MSDAMIDRFFDLGGWGMFALGAFALGWLVTKKGIPALMAIGMAMDRNATATDKATNAVEKLSGKIDRNTEVMERGFASMHADALETAHRNGGE